jgi:hypothetical protein
MALTTHHSNPKVKRKSGVIPLLLFWALMACPRVKFTF